MSKNNLIEFDSHILIRACGNAFNDGKYDLRSLETVVHNYRVMLDKLIATQLQYGHGQAKRNIKSNYEVEIKNGSLEFLIYLCNMDNLAAMSASAPTGLVDISNKIVLLYRNVIELYQMKNSIEQRGETAQYNFDESENDHSIAKGMIINGGNVTINVTQKVYDCAQNIGRPLQNVTKNLDGRNIESISMCSKNESSNLTHDDQHSFKSNKEMLSDEVIITGRLDRVSFSSSKGTVVTAGDKHLVEWNEQLRGDMHDAGDVDGVTFWTHPIIDLMKLDKKPVAYKIYKCEIP